VKAEGTTESEMSEYEQKKAAFRQRTKSYAARIVRLYCVLPKGRVEVQVLGKQLLRSGTSVAANYREASRARSAAEFSSKVDLCTQEADESMLWLELLREECNIISDACCGWNCFEKNATSYPTIWAGSCRNPTNSSLSLSPCPKRLKTNNRVLCKFTFHLSPLIPHD